MKVILSIGLLLVEIAGAVVGLYLVLMAPYWVGHYTYTNILYFPSSPPGIIIWVIGLVVAGMVFLVGSLFYAIYTECELGHKFIRLLKWNYAKSETLHYKLAPTMEKVKDEWKDAVDDN